MQISCFDSVGKSRMCVFENAMVSGALHCTALHYTDC